MKKLLFTVTLGMAIALAGPTAYAQTNNKAPVPVTQTTKPAEAAKVAPD